MSEPRAPRLAASVVIPTCNRVEELRALLASLQRQTVPLEILVMDDAASDVTRDMVAKDFPAVRYFRLDSRRGPAYQRNRGIELATSDIVFPVDDDTVFPSPFTAEQTLREFDDSRVAAIGIPYVNVRQDSVVRQRSPRPGTLFVTDTFVGASHAVRRDIFLRVGGFREHLFYMGEESDYCIRVIDAGHVIAVGSADPIHHLESPRRRFDLVDYYASRNHVLFAWHNVPMPYLIPHLAATIFKAATWTFRPDRLRNRVTAICSALSLIATGRASRRPVTVKAYKLSRNLKKSGPKEIGDATTRLAMPASQ